MTNRAILMRLLLQDDCPPSFCIILNGMINTEGEWLDKRIDMEAFQQPFSIPRVPPGTETPA